MADEEKKASSATGKIVATVFGAVVAPVLVAVGIKWLDPNRTSGGPPTTAGPPPAVAPTTHHGKEQPKHKDKGKPPQR